MGCCSNLVTPVDCKNRLLADISEEPGPMHKTCVIIDYIQSWGAFVAMVGAGVTFFMVWGVNKSTVFTYGQPMPMFLEGGCLCNGELCPDVLFTFNLSLPPSGETVKDEDAYWETWRETVWWDLDGNHPGFSVAGASTPEDDLLFFKYGSCTNTLALSMLGIDHDQCTSMLRKQLLEEAQPGDELLFEVVAPHELDDNGTVLRWEIWATLGKKQTGQNDILMI
jgi:hypothetical protein